MDGSELERLRDYCNLIKTPNFLMAHGLSGGGQSGTGPDATGGANNPDYTDGVAPPGGAAGGSVPTNGATSHTFVTFGAYMKGTT